MKRLAIVGLLFVGLSGQAFSMGHPHNIFAARKQLRIKAATSVVKTKNKPTASLSGQTTVQLVKTSLSDFLISTLSQLRQTSVN